MMSFNLRRKSAAFAFLLLLPLVSGNQTAQAGLYQLAHTFESEVPGEYPFFGSSLAFEGNLTVIKSHSGYLDGDGLSATHIFEESPDGTWTKQKTFEFNSGDNRGNPYFSQELAIDNREIVISYGPLFTTTPRQAIEFATNDGSGWSTIFNAPTPFDAGFANYSGIRNMGRVVDISGDLTLADHVGVRRADGGMGVGRVFEKQSDGLWHETANLVPNSIAENGDNFVPDSLALDGKTAVITNRRLGFGPAGGTYFFERSNSGEWMEVGSFLQEGNVDFGGYLDLDGNTTVVSNIFGQPFEDAPIIYERDEQDIWTETGPLPLVGPDTSFDNFGVAVEGDLIATPVTNTSRNIDQVAIFRRTSLGIWSLLDTIDNPTGAQNSGFGKSLAFSNGRLLVGYGTDGSAEAAYLFEPVVLSGDFDMDGDVDGADFLYWQRNNETSAALAEWKSHYGERNSLVASNVVGVPEPSTLTMLLIFSVGLSVRHRKICKEIVQG